MRYLRKFNESTEEEINRILDKISDNGINSLSNEEKRKLDKFNGKFTKEEPDEKMSFDKDGNILINGVPYSKYYSKEKPSDRLPKVNTSKSKGGDISKSILSNYQKIHKDYRLLNILNDDDKSVVAVYVPVNDNIRTYFIYFRDVSVEEKYSVIKMVYSLNSRAHKPFDVYDNYDNELDFSKMEIYLKEVGLSFGDFNNAWFYVEDDFINQGYK